LDKLKHAVWRKGPDLGEQLCIPTGEAALADAAVAIVSGALAGVIVYYAALLLKRSRSLWADLGAAVLGYLFARVVCQYMFPQAHKQYGGNHASRHRMYDAVGVVSALSVRRYLVFNAGTARQES